MSLHEFLTNITEELMKLGLDKRFLENPAFTNGIQLIVGSILEGPIDTNKELIGITKKDNEITFKWYEWKNNVKSEYRYKIVSPSPDTFQLIKTIRTEPHNDENGVLRKNFVAIEKIVKIYKDNRITITDSYANANNITDSTYIERNPHFKTEYFVSTEKSFYSPYGIMTESIEKNYKAPSTLDLDISTSAAITHIILSNARHDDPKYTTWTHMRREKLDTAKYTRVNKDNGTEYNATLPLNTEHSLRKMVIAAGYGQCPEEVVIEPLTQEEIDALIKRENNPKVEEGLRIYATDRDTYSYDSKTDEKFVRTGFEKYKTLS